MKYCLVDERENETYTFFLFFTSTTRERSMNNEPTKWYYDARVDPWLDTEPLSDDWQLYQEEECKIIEEAYKTGKWEVNIGLYTIDLTNKIQYKNDDSNKTKQRLVMRFASDKIDYNPLRQRFDYPASPIKKTISAPGVWMSPFIAEYMKRNPHFLHKNDIAQIIIHGIRQEGKLLNQVSQAEIFVKELENLSVEQLKKACVTAYTKSTTFYTIINDTLRENDLSKVDTLGAFCSFLSNYLSEPNFNSDEQPINLIYRGLTLTDEMLNEYKNSVGQIRSWLAFSSTTKKRSLAELFGKNTLFIIEYISNTAPTFPGKYIARISNLPEEEEVLLQPGVDFRIEEIIESHVPGQKHTIYLTLL